MIVNRRTWTVKPGRADAVVEILQHGADHIANRPNYKVWQTLIGEGNRVMLELEFEDLTGYERFWNEWGASPEAAQVLEEFQKHVESAWTNEIWRLR